jgi:vacuolar iron transporter family protein
MMNFELKLELRAASGPWWSALVMGVSYLLGKLSIFTVLASGIMNTNRAKGGLIPMIPYFAVQQVNTALFISIGVTAVMLLIFGYVKGIVTGTSRQIALYGAVETLLIGAVAAGVSYGIVKGVDSGFDLKM